MVFPFLVQTTSSVWQTRFKRLWDKGRIWITATTVAGGVVALRLSGIIQIWELNLIDQWFRTRPLEPRDHRILIVSVTEADIQELQQWPISDANLAQLLGKIQQGQPRVIGLDLYRNFPNSPGSEQLQRVLQSMPNLVGIALLGDDEKNGVAPPAALATRHQVGFNNIVPDVDRRIRRSLLYWSADGKTYESLAIKLATQYLQPLGIKPQTVTGRHPPTLQLGTTIFPPLGGFLNGLRLPSQTGQTRVLAYDGSYVQTHAGGYQIFINYRGPTNSFDTISLMDVLRGQVSPEHWRDRIVLIGSTAESLNDFVVSPYSHPQQDVSALISGVELQANFTSQILSAVLDGRPLLKSWAEPVEWFWIWVWAWTGTYVSWRLRSPQKSFVVIIIGSAVLIALSYGLFLWGWITPCIPPLLALLTSAGVVTSYIAHAQEELKRSQEFLHHIIDSIPDPVFVKDSNHRWVMLNDAYAQLVGLPVDALLGKSVHDIFAPDQAERLREEDAWVLHHREPQETEATFMNLQGARYHVATKRSLHQDRRGNLYLVGVIRDITQRKTLEEELRRTTDALSRDNAALRLSQDQLSYLANHDPLTGLPNRKLFREQLVQSLRWAAQGQQQVALLFLDLDGFKQVNDNLGHAIGDLLLQAVARRLSTCLRASDMVARLGGDEFVVILPAIPGIQEAKRVAHKILGTLAEGFGLEGHSVQVTTSIGLSLYPNDSQDADQLIQQADTAMYRAKKCGKNRLALATGEGWNRKIATPETAEALQTSDPTTAID
jgi:diguanylate cyclase (GGDEF)-like protein/PAS domain S-box-containing protein